MQHYYFEDKVFISDVEVIINCSQEEMENYLGRKLKDKLLKVGNNRISNGCFFTLQKDDNQIRVIWIKKFDWSVSSQAVLAHELLHFILAVMDYKDIPISKKNEETMTYYFQSYYTQIWWKLRTLNPNHKNIVKKHQKKRSERKYKI